MAHCIEVLDRRGSSKDTQEVKAFARREIMRCAEVAQQFAEQQKARRQSMEGGVV